MRASKKVKLCSAAVALDVRDGHITDARVAAGGVATVPWRLRSVEESLRGKPVSRASFEEAAAQATEGVKPLAHNAFKGSLLKRTIIRALLEITEGGLR